MQFVCGERGANAQVAGATWIGGAGFQVGPPPPIAAIGLHLSRLIVSSGNWGVRLTGSVFTHTGNTGDKVNVANNPCCAVPPAVSRFGQITALLTVGPSGAGATVVPFLFGGGGVYATRFDGASASGPSGAVEEGGLGWRLPVAGDHLIFDAGVRRYQNLGRNESRSMALAVRFSYGW